MAAFKLILLDLSQSKTTENIEIKGALNIGVAVKDLRIISKMLISDSIYYNDASSQQNH